MDQHDDDVGAAVRDALGRELLQARRARDAVRVEVQRSLLSAIDNAGAVAAPQTYDASEPGLGRTEVARRTLDLGAVRALFAAELDERARAVAEYHELGQLDAAEMMEAQRQVTSEYLDRLAELAAPAT